MNNPTRMSVQEAKALAHQIAVSRREAEKVLEACVNEAATATHAYRKGFAEAIVKAEGTQTVREAQAKAEAADLELKRDIARGMERVAQERLRGLEGERSILKTLMDWNSRLEQSGV